jgi:stage II sporulation protein AB (anti-sigma F factor)
MLNDMKLEIPAMSENEALARSVVAAFAARLEPTLEEVEDIRTAVSEAVTNAIIHGYADEEPGLVVLYARVEDDRLFVEIIDYGRGIDNIDLAREPFYTSRPDLERSGMGFTIMESFMDTVEVVSLPGEGTRVRLSKRITPDKEGADT